MGIDDYHREGSAFNVLEKLNYKDSAMWGTKDDTGVFSGYKEGLLCHLLILVEEAVLILAKVCFQHVCINVDYTILVHLAKRQQLSNVGCYYSICNWLLTLNGHKDGVEAPANHKLFRILGRVHI